MPIFIVFVLFKQTQAAGGYRTVRYIDSQWADSAHADARKLELENSLEMFGVPDWIVSIKRGAVADVGLSAGPTAPTAVEPSPDARKEQAYEV